MSWKQSLRQWHACRQCICKVTPGIRCKGQRGRGGLWSELGEVECTRREINPKLCCTVCYRWDFLKPDPMRSVEKSVNCVLRFLPRAGKRGRIYLLTPDPYWSNVSINGHKYRSCLCEGWAFIRAELISLGIPCCSNREAQSKKEVVSGMVRRWGTVGLHLHETDWSPLCDRLSHTEWSSREARRILKLYTGSFQYIKQFSPLKSSYFLLLTYLVRIWKSTAYSIFCLEWKMRINVKICGMKWNLCRKLSNMNGSLL